MNCRECHDKLSLYIDGQLTDAERMRVEEALERCPECVEELNILRELVDELGAEEEIPVPTALLQDLKDAFRQEVAARDEPKREFSLIKTMGTWRIAASVAALLFASWAVFLDQSASKSAPKAASEVSAENEAPNRRAVPQETASVDLDEERAARKSLKKSLNTLIDPNAPEQLDTTPEEELEKFGNKSGAAEKKMAEKSGRNLRIDESGKKQEEDKLDDKNPAGSAKTLDGFAPVLKQDYEILERRMRAESDGDFEAEPLDSGMAAALRSRVPRASTKGLTPPTKSSNKSVPPSVAPRKAMVEKSKSTGGRRQGGDSEKSDQAWAAKKQEKVSTTAYFALGDNALTKIDAVAKEKGLTYSTSVIDSMAKDKSNSELGSLVTFEVDEEQKDALLKSLQGRPGMKLQLFGKTPVSVVRQPVVDEEEDEDAIGRGEKPESKRARKKDRPRANLNGVKKKTASGAPASSRPATGSKKRFRISFIVLAP